MAPRSYSTADEDVLLVTVDHVGPMKGAKYPQTEGIRALSADDPGVPECSNAKSTNEFVAVLRAETQEHGRNDTRHVTRQFERITLGPTDNTCRTETRGDHVNDVHRASAPAGFAKYLASEGKRVRYG